MVEGFLEDRKEVLKGIEGNYKLIKKNAVKACAFTEKLKDELIVLRMKNQLLIRNAYIMHRIDSVASMLNDLFNSTELIDVVKELKNNKKHAIEMINELIQLINELDIKAEFKNGIKKVRGWVPWER